MRLPLLLAPLLTVGRTTTAEDPPGRHAVHEKGCFEGFTLFSPLLSKTTFLIDMDGETPGRLPLTARIVPGALWIRA